jgi:hypothetical protein
MTPTRYRDEVAQLSKTDVSKAAEVAEKIDDPWFQAQAWSHLARHADKPLPFARKAAKSASKGRDDYQRSAVRAWEIAALAERKLTLQARRSLAEALELAASVTPVSSRAESLLLLFQAAFKISKHDAAEAGEVLRIACSSTHWRAARARKDVEKMLSGESQPREFFW